MRHDSSLTFSTVLLAFLCALALTACSGETGASSSDDCDGFGGSSFGLNCDDGFSEDGDFEDPFEDEIEDDVDDDDTPDEAATEDAPPADETDVDEVPVEDVAPNEPELDGDGNAVCEDEDALCPEECSISEYDGKTFALCGQDDEDLEWTDARDGCEAMGGHLARIDSADAYAFVQTFAEENDVDEFWLGANDLEEEGTWVWIVGDPNHFWTGDEDGDEENDLFSVWYDDEPNNGGNQDCLRGIDDDGWRSTDCDRDLAYICAF